MEKFFYHGLSLEGFHKLFYRRYGDPTSKNVIVAVHGLTRNSSDFHFLGEDLSKKYCMYAPDVVGRGQSDCFKNGTSYTFPQYLADMNVMLGITGAETVDWIGTSMGGLFGMILASLPNSPIRRLILNDIGPQVPQAALDRLKEYAITPQYFKDFDEAKAFFKKAYAPFGIQTEDQWDYVVKNSVWTLFDKRMTLAYDTNSISASTQVQTTHLWNYWEKITCPVLVINGENSDLLKADTLEKMKSMGPKFEYAQVPNVGHAPMFYTEDQIKIIRDWLG